jgi:hypothetical protein
MDDDSNGSFSIPDELCDDDLLSLESDFDYITSADHDDESIPPISFDDGMDYANWTGLPHSPPVVLPHSPPVVVVVVPAIAQTGSVPQYMSVHQYREWSHMNNWLAQREIHREMHLQWKLDQAEAQAHASRLSMALQAKVGSKRSAPSSSSSQAPKKKPPGTNDLPARKEIRRGGELKKKIEKLLEIEKTCPQSLTALTTNAKKFRYTTMMPALRCLRGHFGGNVELFCEAWKWTYRGHFAQECCKGNGDFCAK